MRDLTGMESDMTKRLLSMSLVVVLTAGCSFDKWSNSSTKPDPQPARVDKTRPAEADVTDPAANTSISPLPDETINKVQGFTQRANLGPVKSARPETPVAPVPNATRTEPAPTPVATTTPPANSAELPSPIKWLDNHPADLNLGPKQDPTPPAPVAVTPVPAPAVVITPAVPTYPAESIEAKLARAARDYPRDLSAQLDQQLLQMLSGRQVPQIDGISQLPRDDRELLSALLDSLSNLRSNLKTDVNLAASQKARPLIDLGERLRAGADLRVATIALCSRVDGFGVYQPMSVDRLPSGRETSAVLYCEIENFLSRQADAGQWETNLSQEITLYNDRGQRVWSEKARPVKDLCRNRRHDFFVGQRITLPSALLPGSYSLRVTIVDQNANRVAESTLGVKVIADR